MATFARKVDPLYQLQGIDSSLDESTRLLEQVLEKLADRTELEATRSRLDETSAQWRRIETQQKDLELLLQDSRDKVAALDKKLYGGSVRNPKELASLSEEKEQFRRQIDRREDDLLEVMVQAESLSALLHTAQADWKRAEAQWQQQQEALSHQRLELEAQISALQDQRQRPLAQANPASLQTYEALRKAKGGLAVAAVRQRTCQACRVTLPINEEIRARNSRELVSCQSCGRILYATA